MYTLTDAIGWLGSRIAVFKTQDGYELLDVVRGNTMLVKGV